MRLLIALFLSCSLVTFAQKRRDHKIVKFSPKDVRAIVQNDEVTGYYFASLVVDGEFKRIYGVQLYDRNLQPSYYKEFRIGAYSILEEIKSDGKNYCLKFYNGGKGKTELILLNSELEQTGSVRLKNAKGELSSMYSLVSIPGVGFSTFHNDRKRFRLNTYTPEGKILWTYTSDYAEKKAREYFVKQISAQGNLIAFKGTNYRSIFKADKNDEFLLLLDPKTGQKLLRMNLPNNIGIKMVREVVEKPDGYLLTGICHSDGGAGMALWHISKEGNLLKEKYVNLVEQLNKLRKYDGKTIKSISAIHEITVFSDNRIVGVAETGVDKGESMITCVLDADWEVENVNVVSNSNWTNLSEVDKSDENFYAYRYMVGSAPDDFSFVFVDSRNFTSSNKVTLVNADVNGSKVKKSEWYIASAPTFYKVLPAKKGHVVICEFYEKEKRLSFKMEEF